MAGASGYKTFENTFFYRTHLLWNRLPLSIREISNPNLFKSKTIKYLWQESFSDIISEYEDQITPLINDLRNSLPQTTLSVLNNNLSLDAE